MCLGVPMRVVSVGEDGVVAEIDGVRKDASLMLLDEEVKEGDFIIVHAGFAISKLDEEDARETLRLMREVFRPEDMA
ncbi:HypC/HybG/HupF family hydrogenase formation chaperone [Geobacter benzoatilyticus]|uniref:HypC/HybG/HupF family hydrogenase formation chaperone n=1 Tax=Geobacter benzoatilyticus TaxID=2815309 RepID=A0ABX7Q576_9BACT|nr:HypC/HybG/HupF family hydrogenase formation chaperone [Geobacter benzoatilyticus]QSV46601.1 HypC/HybG/HupF family hydrogenase formation chaperone [Geobacter benzoatilyticus]